jgi:predicted nucleotidyltransferase component of viral defense system
MGCELASLDDLACMKLVAIAQRGTKKDFIDVYTIIRHYKPLPELLEFYKQKYATDNIASVLMSLVYFDDAESDPPPSRWTVPWNEVKHSLAQWVRQI